ncbi:hypothetical protein KY342_05145 [Candidatus Woesearchaeota archaeon]|nr:hypothetical protein [Candidatus Woesearchaeota archaeon]
MTRMSEQEVQDALASNREYRWRTRLPETPDATVKYLSFTGHYRLEHPDVTHLEVHDAAMKAHPEWWPNT